MQRDTLFSGHAAAEALLQALMSLYVASHYRNTPDDLLMLADAPAHHLFALLGPVDESQVPHHRLPPDPRAQVLSGRPCCDLSGLLCGALADVKAVRQHSPWRTPVFTAAAAWNPGEAAVEA